MKIFSVLEKMSRKIESFFEEELVDISMNRKISKLEQRIYAQGSKTKRKYSKLLSELNQDFFEIDNESLKRSVRSRINSNRQQFALQEILNDISIEDFLNLNASLRIDLKAAEELEAMANEYSFELMFELQSLFTSVEHHLREKKIKKLLIRIIAKIQNPKIQLHNRIQLTTSLLSFFDQVFNLKKVNSGFNADCSGFNFHLNTKSIFYGRKIYRIIPITN